MSRTSTAVKRRYNQKTYKRWIAEIRNAEYDEIEAARGDMSRAEFLRTIFRFYAEHNGTEETEE